MITIALPLALLLLPAGLLTGWYFTRQKYRKKLVEQTTEFQSGFTSVKNESEQKTLLIAQLSDEKTALAQNLESSLASQKNLKEKYDALYIKHIELTNERNRLKDHVKRIQG